MKELNDKRLKQLNTLIEMTALVTSSLDSAEVNKLAVESAIKLLGVEAGSLLLLDQDSDELFFEVAVGNKSDEINLVRFKKDLGIAGWVATNSQPVLIHDVSSDKRFYIGIDEISGFNTRSMVCVPVRDKDKIIGVLQLINKIDGNFDNDDVMILQTFANQVAIAIENANLYQEAVTDGHTGLYHQKYFKLRLKEEIARSLRYHYPISVIMMDIDFFKKVNDRYGHPVGSKVIEGIAEIIKNITRVTDIAARYGGEEFALILPYSSYQYGMEIGERLRSTIERSDFGEINITVSVGIGYYDGGGRDIRCEELIGIADRALYNAKESGRNMVKGFSFT
ncbi:MAG: sensor domain-containing diguanylate cyclase [Thermodesulfovibrionia bacterium]|nr:sensor domain-containing diguanylate cyclase [Thermodesulfovibrionia bacterium]